MKIFVLNLEKDRERKQNIISQFEEYGITDYEFVTAVDGSKLDLSDKRIYNDKVAKRVMRGLTPGEVGCASSHIQIYKKIVESNQRAIILEDDTIITREFADFCKTNSVIPNDVDVLLLYFFPSTIVHSNTIGISDITIIEERQNEVRKFSFDNIFYEIDKLKIYKVHKCMHEVDLIYSTGAYSPSVNACKEFIKINTPVIVPADCIWNFFKDLTKQSLSMYSSLKTIVNVEYDPLTELAVERNKIINNIPNDSIYAKRTKSQYYNR